MGAQTDGGEHICMVAGLASQVDDALLAEKFSVLEPIWVKVSKDPRTGKSEGFGHVAFASEDALKDALLYDRTELAGKAVRILRASSAPASKTKPVLRSGVAKEFQRATSDNSAHGSQPFRGFSLQSVFGKSSRGANLKSPPVKHQSGDSPDHASLSRDSVLTPKSTPIFRGSGSLRTLVETSSASSPSERETGATTSSRKSSGMSKSSISSKSSSTSKSSISSKSSSSSNRSNRSDQNNNR